VVLPLLQATFDLSVECNPQSMVVKMKPVGVPQRNGQEISGVFPALQVLLLVAARALEI
jgi:hypothetical protein